MKFKSWVKSGDPWIWMIGGALAISVIMVVGLLSLIAVRGFAHFWPAPLVEAVITQADGSQERVLGEVVESETLTAQRIRESGEFVAEEEVLVTRYLFKVGNRELGSRDFIWHLDSTLGEWTYPQDAIMLERREWGNFYGFAKRLERDGQSIADGDGLWDQLQGQIRDSSVLADEIRQIEDVEIGRINKALEQLRLRERGLDQNQVSGAERETVMAEVDSRRATLEQEYEVLRVRRDELRRESLREVLIAETINGVETSIPVSHIVVASRNNALGLGGKLAFYGHRIKDFLTGGGASEFENR